MRRYLIAALFSGVTVAATAQADSTQPGTRPKTVLPTTASFPRSADHLLLQLGYTTWQGAPDSINTGGLPRTFNAYLMFEFPFKTNPHWSAAIGAGIATDAMYFEKSAVAITGTTTNLVFQDLTDTSHFKKYKLATSYAEAPVELRYSSKPDESRSSVKLALGVKVGLLLNAHTKGNTLQNRNGNAINDYKEKLFNKRYFNKQRIAATARAGIGNFSLFGSYQLTPLFREGVAAEIRPFTVGLTISGL